MSDNLVVEARQSALENAVYLAVAKGTTSTNEVLALADTFTDWIMTGESPAAKFARVEAERFFQHPSRGAHPRMTIVDEMGTPGEDAPTT